jgi:hypothetical protein
MARSFSKTIRYGVAIVCIGAVIFWDAKEPPVLDMKQMQISEGTYNCIWQNGSKSGTTGAHVVDGLIYYSSFSYIFGLAPGLCFKELDGRKVRIAYFNYGEPRRRLRLEIVDLESKRIFGASNEKMLSTYQTEIKTKLWFYLIKIGLLLLTLRLTCWSTEKSGSDSN